MVFQPPRSPPTAGSPPSPPPPPSPSSSSSSTALHLRDYQNPIKLFGFEVEEISAQKVSGRFQVTSRCCQPFKVLHGGVSALIAEDLGSAGAYHASGAQRVAGVNLSISHFKSAKIGDLVLVEGTPLSGGKTIQVWEVRFWKTTNSEDRSLISSARVTVLCNMPTAVTENHKIARKNLIKIAKL